MSLGFLWGCQSLPTSIAVDNAGDEGEISAFEGAARGFPSLRDLHGRKLADGDFAQWLENGRLHVRIRYEFSPAHYTEETAVFRQEPRLEQQHWSWEELRDGMVLRRFGVDFNAGTATAEKREGEKLKRWSERVEILPGQTFAGFGFSLAIKTLRDRLVGGEKIVLKGIGFTPKPKVGTLEIFYQGVDRMTVAGRVLKGDRFVIHAKIPWIARPFVRVPDQQLWLINPPPAGFLRSEGPLMEPNDPVVRVDLFPGDPSGPAEPASP